MGGLLLANPETSHEAGARLGSECWPTACFPARSARGETIVIAKAGHPLARLVAYEPRPALRFGSLKGAIEIPDDFDSLAADAIGEMFGERPRRA